MNLKRRIPQYILGLVFMAVGLVFIKRLGMGISPISSVPDAISSVTPFTLGNVTIAFHVFCVLGQIIVNRRPTVKIILTLPLAIAFGYLIDLCMLIIDFSVEAFWLRLLLLVPGIAVSALGVVLIVGADLMLPAPDALMRTISAVYKIPLSKVKTTGDVIWVASSVIIDLSCTGTLHSVGLGTVCTAIFVGKCIGIYNKHFPGLNMDPLVIKPKSKD